MDDKEGEALVIEEEEKNEGDDGDNNNSGGCGRISVAASDEINLTRTRPLEGR